MINDTILYVNKFLVECYGVHISIYANAHSESIWKPFEEECGFLHHWTSD